MLNWALSHLSSNFWMCREAIPGAHFLPQLLVFPPTRPAQSPTQPSFSKPLSGWSFQNANLIWVRTDQMRQWETSVHTKHLGKSPRAGWASGPECALNELDKIWSQDPSERLFVLQTWQSSQGYRKRWEQIRKASQVCSFEGCD